jgi:hypothetical protein
MPLLKIIPLAPSKHLKDISAIVAAINGGQTNADLPDILGFLACEKAIYPDMNNNLVFSIVDPATLNISEDGGETNTISIYWE